MAPLKFAKPRIKLLNRPGTFSSLTFSPLPCEEAFVQDIPIRLIQEEDDQRCPHAETVSVNRTPIAIFPAPCELLGVSKLQKRAQLPRKGGFQKTEIEKFSCGAQTCSAAENYGKDGSLRALIFAHSHAPRISVKVFRSPKQSLFPPDAAWRFLRDYIVRQSGPRRAPPLF